MKAILKYPITLLVILLSLILIFVLAIIRPNFVHKGLLFLTKKWNKMLKPKKRK